MPPKKKGAKVKSAAVAAKEAELAREVGLLRFEKERERLRNEELMLRQRLEEEEMKLLEDHRVRETQIRNAIAERDRQANYYVRERELTAMLGQRERETQELRAKVLGLQQAQTVLENEKDSAVRRTTMLVGELETAHQKLTEAQEKLHAAVTAHDAATSTMQAEYDALRAETVTLRARGDDAAGQIHKLEAEVQELAAKLEDEGKHLTLEDGSPEAILQMNPRTRDAESVVLLNVLHAEVEKYKEVAARLQSDLDRKARDEEKSSLLVGILNTQLDSVREENKRLHAKAMKHQAEAEAVNALVGSEKQRNRDLYEEMDRATSEGAVARRQLQLEVDVHKKQVEELTNRLDQLTTAHTKLQSQHEEVSTKSTQREQEDFRANVTMKSELDKQKKDLAHVLQEKQAVEDEAFNYKILTRAEMDGLKTRVQKFQETMERKDREAFEMINVLREEAAKHETERQREVNSFKLEVTRLTSDLEKTLEELNRTSTELAEKQANFTRTENDLYEKLVHMTACHDTKHSEVERLRVRLAEKEEAYTSNTIFLNAEKENLKARVEELLAEAQKRRTEHLQHVEAITTDLDDLRSRMSREMSEQDALYTREKNRAEMAERNVKRLQDQIREMQSVAQTKELTTDDVVKSLKSDARELRSELSIAKRTIERMEGAFGDQTAYNQLKELNERLTKEVGSYSSQVAHLNSVIVAMKLEQDMMGGYKLQKALDEVEQLTRTVRQQERIQKLTMPLFRELRAVAERAGISASVRATLEKYDTQLARVKAAATNSADNTAAAAPAAADDDDCVYAEAAAEKLGKQGMNTTLPAVLQPRRPSGPRNSRLMEAYFDKKTLVAAATATNANNTNKINTSGGELPALNV